MAARGVVNGLVTSSFVFRRDVDDPVLSCRNPGDGALGSFHILGNPQALASSCARNELKRPSGSVSAARAWGARGPDAKGQAPFAHRFQPANASTPRGDQIIPRCLQRSDTAQSWNWSAPRIQTSA